MPSGLLVIEKLINRLINLEFKISSKSSSSSENKGKKALYSTISSFLSAINTSSARSCLFSISILNYLSARVIISKFLFKTPLRSNNHGLVSVFSYLLTLQAIPDSGKHYIKSN